MVRGERDRTQRDLRSRCCYLPVALSKVRGTPESVQLLAQSCTDPSHKDQSAQHDENGRTENSNPLPSSAESMKPARLGGSHPNRICVRSPNSSPNSVTPCFSCPLECKCSHRCSLQEIKEARSNDQSHGRQFARPISCRPWWIHDHLPYSELQFFPKLAAFNIGWHEFPRRRISSFTPPRGVLTKPGLPNHEGDHSDQYRGFPTHASRVVPSLVR